MEERESAGTGAGHPVKLRVEGEGIRVVRPGFEKGRMPQGVLGVDAISHDTGRK